MNCLALPDAVAALAEGGGGISIKPFKIVALKSTNYNYGKMPSDYILQSEVPNKMDKHTLRSKTRVSVKYKNQERLLRIIIICSTLHEVLVFC